MYGVLQELTGLKQGQARRNKVKQGQTRPNKVKQGQAPYIR